MAYRSMADLGEMDESEAVLRGAARGMRGLVSDRGQPRRMRPRAEAIAAARAADSPMGDRGPIEDGDRMWGTTRGVPGAPAEWADRKLSADDAGMPPSGRWDERYEWTGPEAASLSWGDPSRMGGFNTAGWGSGDRGTNSMKNTFGKIASRYDPTQGGSLDAILGDPDFQTFFPNARKVGFDKIDFGDGNPVDVWVAASETGGGKNWAWQVGGPGTPGRVSASAADASVSPWLSRQSGAQPQVQDPYGRAPRDPNYGLPPQPGETGLLDPRTRQPIAINPDAYARLTPSMEDLAYPELP